MKRLLNTLLLSLACVLVAHAEDVVFQASAPAQVVMGHTFQITYTINQRSRELRAPEMPDFDILAGPFVSQSSNMQLINGHMSASYTMRYTYTLMPRKEGSFAIQPATIQADGKTYRSNGIKITVLPPDEPTNSGEAMQTTPSGSRQQAQQSASTSGNADVFIKTIVSKTRVHEQEHFLLSYKLYYTGIDGIQFTNNVSIPEFKGFLKQEIELGEVQTQLEHYEGKNYQTAVFYQTLLYPQRAGDITIDPASFEAMMRVPNRSQVRSIFYSDNYTTVTRTLRTGGTTIHVSALPSGRPAGFSGGVGKFNIASSITGTNLQNNDAVTIRLDITGSGNMKLLATPEVEWPEGFEVYDPKITNNYRTTTSGISGTKQIEYLAIARAAGDYTIPAIRFSYFDIESGEYKTLQTESYAIHVARGEGNAEPTVTGGSYVAKEDIKELGTDIRYIITTETKHQPAAGSVFDNRLWWLAFVLPLVLLVLLIIFFRKHLQENSDATRVRYKKANKVAQKRLKQAKACLKNDDAAHFYEEIEKAAWSYLSDRLSIPTADLTKDNIADILRGKQVEETLIKEVKDLLSTAEFARYAPSAAGNREQLYNAAVELIDKLEDQKL